METFPSSNAEGGGIRPWPAPLEPQSDTGTHERRKKLPQAQPCRCCWVQPPFRAALNAAGPGEAEDTAPLVESALLLPPSQLLCTPTQLRGREGSSPPLPSLGRGDVPARCPNTLDTTISRQCLTHENDATFRTGGGGRRALCLASLHSHPTKPHSLRFPGWVMGPGERRWPWPRMNGYSWGDAAGNLGGRAQPPAVSRRQI